MVSITDKAEFLNFWNREAVEFNTLHSHQIMFDEKTIFETFLYYKNHTYKTFKHTIKPQTLLLPSMAF